MAAATGIPDLSVIVPTFNRGRLLRPLLERLLGQDTEGVTYDVVVVDNNSTDETREIVMDAIAHDSSGRLRYVFEPRQGVSYARNTGVEHSDGPIVVFLDDDGLPDVDWVRSMKRAFDEYPQADCIGGRVRPQWSIPRPSWLGDAHMGPVALQDRPNLAWFNKSNAASCLLTANLGFRRDAFIETGGFSPEYPRNQDRELELRFWRAGKQGLYIPAMDVVVDVPAERLRKSYHRRWQAATGKYHALMRFRDTLDAQGRLHDEPVTGRRLLGSPLFLYRDALRHITGWVRSAAGRDADCRFFHTTRLWYYAAFFWTRIRTDVAPRLSSPRRWTREPAAPSAPPNR